MANLFVTELRRLSEHCCFIANLEDMLRDRLVCAWHQRCLTFKKAFELAQSVEVVEQNATDIQKPQGQHQVHNVGKPPTKPTTCNCYRCGNAHALYTCCFKDSECHYCF